MNDWTPEMNAEMWEAGGRHMASVQGRIWEKMPETEKQFARIEARSVWEMIESKREPAFREAPALVEALERFEKAFQTGRNEPLVIASEHARAVLARLRGE